MGIQEEIDAIRKKLDEESKVTVKIALFGQPGAGKSSLINKIVGKEVAEVGVETDKTIAEQSYEHNGLFFSDLPGYGTERFPEETYFEQFKINEFDLFLCVTSGKLHQADSRFFKELKSLNKACIFIVNKCDTLWEDGFTLQQLEDRKISDIKKHVEDDVLVIFTSCRDNKGLDRVNTEIQRLLNDAKKERWARCAKAYSTNFLAEKKAACEKYVSYAAFVAAANGINPIPGLDVSIDIGVLVKLFKEIRESYGLNDDYLAFLEKSAIPVVGQLANSVVKYAAQEGIILLLRRVAGRQTVKSLSKYIPFAGQVVAAGIGYAITSNAGSTYLESCHKLAEEALQNNLK